jgi:putative ABC transport system ATP-binding protein
MTSALVEVRDVAKAYRRGAERVHALRGVSLALAPGELVALVGPSGSGKTTLLGLLCGWERPDGGALAWSGELASADGAALPWSELAVVPQALGLLEDLTIAENVGLPIRLAGAAATQLATVERLLDRFGIGHLADRLPAEASLGEQQRAAVARALVLTPRLILADEPSAHQDAGWAVTVFGALRSAASAGAACLVATHDPEGIGFAHRVVTLTDGALA